MPGRGSLKPWSQVPEAYDRDWAVQVQSALNQILSQGNAPPGQGLASVQQNSVSPAAPQLISIGNRAVSITSAITWTSTATSISLFWDGTNGSQPLTIYRDDGTVMPPISGNITISGLTNATKYFFYPFYQEIVPASYNWGGEQVGVNFAKVLNVSLGSPPIAFTAQNPLAIQQQLARDHIQLAPLLASTGITAGAGGSGSGGSGGGGTGGRGGLLP
jgi:hypothetical protein